jgi:hypothetical protein
MIELSIESEIFIGALLFKLVIFISSLYKNVLLIKVGLLKFINRILFSLFKEKFK